MAKIVGRLANFYASTTSTAIGNKVGSVQTWTMNVTEDPVQVTNHDSSGWEQTLKGIRSGSFSAESFEPATGAAIVDIREALIGSSTLYGTFLLSSATSTPRWRGWFRITGLGYSAPTDGPLSVSIDGRFTGSLSTA